MSKKYLSKILKNGQVLYIKDAEARDSKQDKIDDLATIRSGAALGATAIQTETDPTVPAWAKASTKPTYTASEVGLGNVGNFKAVSTVANQGLTDTEKSNARTNIGAGTYSKPSNGIPTSDLAGVNSSTGSTTKYLNEQGSFTTIASDSSILYGTSTTAAATVQKVVSIPSITTLKTGQIIIVKPTITSTVASSTLKLNSFDAYPMRYNNADITTSTNSVVWSANIPSIFIFDGTYWVFAGHGLDSNTTYSAMPVAEGTAGTATTQRTVRADYLKQIIKSYIPTTVSSFTNDAGYLTLHQDISGKEDRAAIVTSTASNTLNTLVGKYHCITTAVGTITITLPAITDLTTVSSVVIYLTAGTTPAVTISASGNKSVYYQDGFKIEAGNTYEINALFNGAAWIVAAVKINTSNS